MKPNIGNIIKQVASVFELKDYTASSELKSLREKIEQLNYDGPKEGKKNISNDFKNVGNDLKKSTNEARQNLTHKYCNVL